MGLEHMTLRIYDIDLITFAIRPKTIGFETEIIFINEKHKHQFPVNLELTNEGVRKWLGSRSIPKNRFFVKEILQHWVSNQTTFSVSFGCARACR